VEPVVSGTSTRVSGAQRRSFRVDGERLQWTIRALPEQMSSAGVEMARVAVGAEVALRALWPGFGDCASHAVSRDNPNPGDDATPGTASIPSVSPEDARAGTFWRSGWSSPDKDAWRDAWRAGPEYGPVSPEWGAVRSTGSRPLDPVASLRH